MQLFCCIRLTVFQLCNKSDNSGFQYCESVYNETHEKLLNSPFIIWFHQSLMKSYKTKVKREILDLI